MSSRFTWMPLFSEVGRLLLDWERRQHELIACLNGLREKGVKVTPLSDQDKDGARFLMKEIDPFTFMGSFNRQTRPEERLVILAEVKRLLDAKSPLPDDFDGVPLLNNQQSWFIGYQSKRGVDDVATLWKVFRLALGESPLDNPQFALAFDAALQVWGVSINLTMGLFWIRPDVFLNLDSVNRNFLDIKLPSEGLTARFYIETVKSIAKRGKDLAELSYEAWQLAKQPAAERKTTANGYWLVGAYWDNRDPADQTERFVNEGIWQNGYEDKYLDEVKSIKVGDRIAIKTSATQKKDLPFDGRGNTVSKMIIKAIGTVVANRGDGRTVEVEWDSNFQAKTWYFYTYQKTIWKIRTDPEYSYNKISKRLINFVWHGESQDYDWFCREWWGSDHAPPSPGVLDGNLTYEPYDVENIVADVFVDKDQIIEALDRIRSKKNLILQGAPGVGKTFIARKLAYALLKEKANDRIEMIQFHQTFSYEDFVRGYRPCSEKSGAFELQDAIFHRFCKRAQDDPDRDYVFIIDEINRGNLSQIFGELLMLIEGDKRGPDFSVPLVYQKAGEARFFVPGNVHLIGLMNVADRSLAIVDYALRRRFAFMTLIPQYASPVFRQWLLERQMKPELVDLLVSRMVSLNQQIAEDPLLGENYVVGHSFFCPKGDIFGDLDTKWYESIVRTEIVPLLKEYWFDNSKRVEEAAEGLLAK